jgi:hypothetical protein
MKVRFEVIFHTGPDIFIIDRSKQMFEFYFKFLNQFKPFLAIFQIFKNKSVRNFSYLGFLFLKC